MSKNGKNREKKREVYRISFDYETHEDVIAMLNRVSHVYRGIVIADALRFFVDNNGHLNGSVGSKGKAKKSVLVDESGIDLTKTF